MRLDVVEALNLSCDAKTLLIILSSIKQPTDKPGWYSKRIYDYVRRFGCLPSRITPAVNAGVCARLIEKQKAKVHRSNSAVYSITDKGEHLLARARFPKHESIPVNKCALTNATLMSGWSVVNSK